MKAGSEDWEEHEDKQDRKCGEQQDGIGDAEKQSIFKFVDTASNGIYVTHGNFMLPRVMRETSRCWNIVGKMILKKQTFHIDAESWNLKSNGRFSKGTKMFKLL